MADSDTPPPEGRERRTDRATRLHLENLQGIREEVIALKASAVKYDRLMAILAAAATVIVGAAYKVQTDSLTRAEYIHAQDMKAFREDVHHELQTFSAYSMGAYKVVVEQQQPREVAREVRAVIRADGGAH